MSWSRSLRSPSSTPPPPPAPAPAPADVDIGSLWDNEGDRNDPIDIGSVWEPKVKFTETPFTIARRNAAKQPAATAQNVSGATKVNSTVSVNGFSGGESKKRITLDVQVGSRRNQFLQLLLLLAPSLYLFET
jgi:hypothetical protein